MLLSNVDLILGERSTSQQDQSRQLQRTQLGFAVNWLTAPHDDVGEAPCRDASPGTGPARRRHDDDGGVGDVGFDALRVGASFVSSTL